MMAIQIFSSIHTYIHIKKKERKKNVLESGRKDLRLGVINILNLFSITAAFLKG